MSFTSVMLAGRYRLDEPDRGRRRRRGVAGHDVVLERPVAVKLLRARGTPSMPTS